MRTFLIITQLTKDGGVDYIKYFEATNGTIVQLGTGLPEEINITFDKPFIDNEGHIIQKATETKQMVISGQLVGYLRVFTDTSGEVVNLQEMLRTGWRIVNIIKPDTNPDTPYSFFLEKN